jgi:hypothetical protein
MKRFPLIVFLILVIITLGIVLYVFTETAPKYIKNESIGTMYTFGEISFNLVSDDYIENETLKNTLIERGEHPNSLKGWKNEINNDNFVLLSRNEDDLFEEQLELLKNPIHHIQLEKELPSRMEGDLDIYKIDLDYYIGTQGEGILQKNYRNGETLSYLFEMKVGDNYYTVIAQQSEGINLALENITEFMRTVNIAQ